MKKAGIGLVVFILLLGFFSNVNAEFPGASFTPFDYPGASDTFPQGINDSGQITGFYWTSGSHGFLKDGSTFNTIDYPGGGNNTYPNAINNSGQIVGAFNSGSWSYGYGFLRDGSTFSQINFPPYQTYPHSINSNGQMVGELCLSSEQPGRCSQGFILDGSTFSYINYPGGAYIYPSGINDSGQIIGYYFDSSGNTHGFLQDGSALVTIDYPGGSSTAVYGINNSGQIVGNYLDSSGHSHAFLKEGSTFHTFDYPSAANTQFYGINNSGQIVGIYYGDGPYEDISSPGRRRGFVLSIPKYSIPFTGLEADHQGSAAWNTDGTGPEIAKTGHLIPAPYDYCMADNTRINGLVAYYYLASRDYGGIDPQSQGALQFTNPVEGFPDLTAKLANIGSTVSGIIKNTDANGNSDANGTIQLLGTFTSFTFTAYYYNPQYPVYDGIAIQIGADVGAQMIFTDWQSIDIANNIATGTLGSASVTLSGGLVPEGITDGSSTRFNQSFFSPMLETSDAIYIGGDDPAYSYTVTFGTPIQNPVIHLQSLASTLTFSDALIIKLSGEDTFEVNGPKISDFKIKFDLTSLGNDVEGQDWSLVDDLEIRQYSGQGNFVIQFQGQDLVGGPMPRLTTKIKYNTDSCFDDEIYGHSDYVMIQNVYTGNDPALQALADAFIKDTDKKGLKVTFDSLQPAIQRDFTANGRTGAYFEAQTGRLELSDLSIDPSAFFDFGSLNVGSSSLPRIFTVTKNASQNDITLGTIRLEGVNAGEFSLQSDNCSGQILTPLASCTFTALLTPQNSGAKDATLIIPFTETEPASLEVQLKGLGTDLALPREEAESNDTLALANALTSGQDMIGTISDYNDTDSFKLTVPGPGQIKFELISVPEGLNLGFYIYDANGNYWFWVDSKGDGGRETALFYVFEAGDYGVQVYRAGGVPSSVDQYTLHPTFKPLTDIDPYEPNDRLMEAYQVNSGELIAGKRYRDNDEDYYKIVVDGPGQILFELMSVPGVLNLGMEFWGPQENYMGWEDRNGDGLPEARRFDVFEAGPYYVHIYRAGGAAYSEEPYGFKATFIPQSGIDPFEPNNSIAEAGEISAGVPVVARVQYNGDVDFYKIWVEGPGRLTVTLNSVPSETGMGMEFWGPSENYLGWVDAWGEGLGESWSAYVQEAGYYYIKTYGSGGPGFSDSSYSLLVSFTPLTDIDANEPNDSFDQATVLSTGVYGSGKIQSNGDTDYYKISVSQAGQLTFELSDVPQEMNLGFTIYDPARNYITGVDNEYEGGSEVRTITVVNPGDYYAQVYGGWGALSSGGSYKIRAYFGTYQNLSSLMVKPAVATAYIAAGADDGLGLRFVPEGRDSSGNLVPVDPVWSVEPGSGAGSIDYGGWFIPKGAGSVIVRASVGGISGTAAVSVEQVSDGGEPNNVFTQAQTLGLGETVTGGKIFPGGDADIYRIEVAESGQLVVEAQGGADLDIALEVYKTDLGWIAGANRVGSGDKERVFINTAGFTHYFIKVLGSNNSFSATPYTLSTAFTPVPDTYEPNNQFSWAAPVGLNTSFSAYIFPEGDKDYYQIELPSAGRLTISLNEVPAPLNGVLYLYDSSLNQIGWMDRLREGGVEELTMDLQGGIYYILIMDSSENSYSLSPYRFSADFTPLVNLDVYEANDGIEQAKLLASGETKTDSFIYRSGDVDYFWLPVSAAGLVEVSVSNVAFNLDLRLDLFDRAGNNLFSRDTGFGGAGETLSFNVDSGGDYYVKIWDVNNSSFSQPYTLTATYPSVADTTPPGAPLGVVAAAGDGFVFVSWLANGEFDLAGYEVFRSSESGTGYMLVASTLENGFKNGDLTNGQTYYYVIKAYDTTGNRSQISGEVSAAPAVGLMPRGVEQESNNDLHSANPLISGGEIEGAIGDWNDSDFFKLTVPGRGRIVFELISVPADQNLAFYIYDVNGNYWFWVDSKGDGGLERALLDISRGGTYWVQVYRAGGNPSANKYVLSARYLPMVDLDPYEPNDRLVDAYEVTSGEAIGGKIYRDGDEDYYRIAVDGPGQIVFELDNVPAELNLGMEFWGPWENYMGWEDRNGDGLPEARRFDVFEAGPYYVHNYRAGGAAYSDEPYSFKATFIPQSAIDPYEPNNIITEAREISAGVPVVARVQYNGDVDFYKIWVEGPGRLTVNLNSVPPETGMGMEFWGPSENYLGWVDAWGEGLGESWSAYVQEAGYFYIKTYGSGGPGFSDSSYSLLLELDTTPPSLSLDSVTTLTNVNSQVVTGTVEEGATVYVETNTTASDGEALIIDGIWSYSITGLVEGINEITVMATDPAGNSTVLNTSITLDTTPPTVTINPVTTPTRTNSQTISGTVEEGATVLIATDTAASNGQAAVIGNSWSFTITGLVEGLNQITVTASDSLGNSRVATTGITLDTIAPSVTINPVATPTKQSSQTISGTVEAGATVTIVTDTAASDGTAIVTGNNWSYTIIGLVEGANGIAVTATDPAGNSKVITSSITRDTQPPVVTINLVTTPTKLSSQTISGTVEAGASVSVGTNTAASDGPAAVTGTSWSYTITGLVEGANGITVTATDVAGNTASVTSSITRDTVPPSVTIDPVSTPANQTSQTITGTVETGATVYLSTDTSASDGDATVSGNTWSFTVTDLVEGLNTATATATDPAGNTRSVTAVITFDTTPPFATIANIPESPTCSSEAHLIVGGWDVVAYKYKLDEGLFNNETPVTTPIILTDLERGSHMVFVIARDEVGNWQSEESVSLAVWTVGTPLSGDLDGNNEINLADAILALKALTGRYDYEGINLCGDVNGDVKVDMAEVIYILQKLATLR